MEDGEGISEHNLQKPSIRSIPASQKNKQAHRLHCYEGRYPFICLPCFNTKSQTNELFPQSCHVVHVVSFYICMIVQPLPRSIASLFCHFVSSLFTHTGLSMSVPMTTSPLFSSCRSSSLLTPLPCFGRRRGQRKASVASCLSSTQGRVDSFVIRSSTRTGCLASDVTETQSKSKLYSFTAQIAGVTNT